MPRKTLPRLRRVTIKGKEFYQVSVPQPGGGRRLRTFKNADDAKRFYGAVQDEISRLALYSLEEILSGWRVWAWKIRALLWLMTFSTRGR